MSSGAKDKELNIDFKRIGALIENIRVDDETDAEEQLEIGLAFEAMCDWILRALDVLEQLGNARPNSKDPEMEGIVGMADTLIAELNH